MVISPVQRDSLIYSGVMEAFSALAINGLDQVSENDINMIKYIPY